MDTVLITGTTSGIGKAFGEKFASMGNNLVLVSRNRDKLQQQQIDLQSRYQVSVEYISCDLAEVDAVEVIMEKIHSWGLSVDVLVNNAGFNEAGCFTNTSLSNELDMIQVHIKALTTLPRFSMKFFVRYNISRTFGFYNSLTRFTSGQLTLTQGRHILPDDKNKGLISKDLAEKNGLKIGDKIQTDKHSFSDGLPIRPVQCLSLQTGYSFEERMVHYISYIRKCNCSF